jgi:hypothetical protein
VRTDIYGRINRANRWRVAHPLPEVLLFVVCGTICEIAAWGKTHLPLLRRFLPYHHGVPGARLLTIRKNRIDPRTSFAISSNGAGSQHDTTRQIRVLPP